MQLENNNVNTAAAPQNDAGAAMDAAIKTQPQETATQENMMAQGTAKGKNAGEKKGKGMVLGMIFLVILAVGGIGFGMWAMMDGNSQKEQLNSQISTLKQQNSELQEKLSNATTITTDTDTDNSTVNTADYIYVGEWGLKIKIPEGLNKVSYEFKQLGGESQVEGTTIAVSGVAGDDLLDFANFNKNNSTLGAVMRIPKDTYSNPEYGFSDEMKECGYAGLVFSSGDYNYCYSHPQSVYSTDENEQAAELESTKLIEQMLSNKDNYSKF